jgi:hypothetical protein
VIVQALRLTVDLMSHEMLDRVVGNCWIFQHPRICCVPAVVKADLGEMRVLLGDLFPKLLPAP